MNIHINEKVASPVFRVFDVLFMAHTVTQTNAINKFPAARKLEHWNYLNLHKRALLPQRPAFGVVKLAYGDWKYLNPIPIGGGGMNQPTTISLCEKMTKELSFYAVYLQEILTILWRTFQKQKLVGGSGVDTRQKNDLNTTMIAHWKEEIN